MTGFVNSQISRRRMLAGAGATVGALTAAPLLSSCGASSSNSVTTWYFPFGDGVEELYATFKEEFEEENPDISIELQLQPWADRYPKMLTALGAGRGPDVMFMTPDALIQFASAGVLEPLDDLIEDDLWTGLNETTLDSASYDGKRWYFPIDQEVPVWLYNQTLMEKIGLDPASPPETWDDIRTISEVAADHGDDIYGFGYNASSPSMNDTFYPFLHQAGGRVLSEDMKSTTINSDEGIEALSFIVELFEKKWSPQSYLQPEDNNLSHPFFQGNQVVSIQYKQSGIVNARNTDGFDWDLTPVLRHREAWGFGATRSWAISSKAEDKEAAAAWVNFLARPENVLRHSEAFGITPANETTAEGAYADDEAMAQLSERIPETFGELKIENGRALMPLLAPEIQLAIIGEKSPEEALETAAAAIDATLA